jgi:hypothetical protein
MATTMCPYCNIEVSESSIEAEDGCCPECGSVITAKSYFMDNDYEDEYDDDDIFSEFDDDDDDNDFSRADDYDDDIFNDDDLDEDFDEEDF